MSTKCAGNSEDHCCYINNEPCPHLEQNTVEGRRWACGLRRRLGNWDDVLTSMEYRRDVAPRFEPKGMNCRDWPAIPEGKWACSNCGIGIDGR